MKAMNKSPEAHIRRAACFVRSLSIKYPGFDDFSERAPQLIKQDPQVRKASQWLESEPLWALTAKGEKALTSLRDAYSEVLSSDISPQGAFMRLDQAVCSCEQLFNESVHAVYQGRTPHVLTDSLKNALSGFELSYINSFCYTIATLYGPEYLTPLSNLKLGNIEDLNKIKKTMDSILEAVIRQDELGSWTISVFKSGGGQFLPFSMGCYLEWGNQPFSSLVNSLRLRPINMSLAVATIQAEGVIIAGRGNLVGTSPSDSIKLRSSKVHASLPVDAFSATDCNPLNPLKTLQRYYSDDAFCIAPDEFAQALDRWYRIRSRG